MSDQADNRAPMERTHGGDHDEFIGEEVMTEEGRAGFEGEHGERDDAADEGTPEQAADPGPV